MSEKKIELYEEYYDVFTKEERAILAKIEDPNGSMSVTINRINGKTAGMADIRATRSKRYNKFLGIPNYNKYEKEHVKGFFLDETSNVVINDTITMRLDEEVGLAHWNMVKFNPSLKFDSESAYNSDAIFYVEIPELESQKVVDKRMLVHKAEGFILNDNKEELIYRALLLGLDMENDKLAAIQEVLLLKAKNNPQKVIELYTGNLMSVRLLFKKAVKRNLIVLKEGMYYYGIHALGSDEERCLAYLQHKENKHLLEKLDEEYNILTEDASGNSKTAKDDTEQWIIDGAKELELKGSYEEYSEEELKDIKLVILREKAKQLGAPVKDADDCKSKKNAFELIYKFK